MEEKKQSNRIQTSLFNAAERKLLIRMANKMPAWVTSDMLSLVGLLGSVIIGAGYILTEINPIFLWLASFGLVVNWFGDSMDGTLARVRNTQRPVYGYYLDHTLDCICEGIGFIGLGFSPLMDMRIALFIYICYLLMTTNVSMNAHLKGEFKLTYAKMGPTEFRIFAILVNTVLCFGHTIREFRFCGFSILDMAGIFVAAVLGIMYICEVIKDLRYYAKIDPRNK